MAWTAPRTWVALETVTAAIMNTHIRDNFLETEAATAQAAGDLVYADAANSMGSRVGIGAEGARLISTGSAPAWRSSGYVQGGNGEGPNGQYELSGTATAFFGFGDPASVDVLTGDPVWLTVATGTQALVSFGCRFALHQTLGVNVQLSVAVDSFSSAAFSTAWGTAAESDPGSNILPHFRQHLFTGLSVGNHTFYLGATNGAGGGGTSFSRYAMPWLLVEAF